MQEKYQRFLLFLLVLALVQLSCNITEFYDNRSKTDKEIDNCEEQGGTWHYTPYGYCEMPEATNASSPTSQGVTGANVPAKECNAYEHISIEVIIAEQAQYDTWRSCTYYLRVTNNLPDQDIWLWTHHIHATEAGIDRDEWDSATVEAGATEEWTFMGDFQNDGSFGHSYASEIAAILAVPGCNDMRSRTNAITLARAITWYCGP